jgi:DNA replication protein DnaC
VGLARAAIAAGHRTYYTTAADLVAKCHRAALEGRWATTMRFYAGPKLLVIDEVGYLPMPGDAAAALFQVVTQRYPKGSIALTTNLGIGSWDRIFDDPMIAEFLLSWREKALVVASRLCGRRSSHRPAVELVHELPVHRSGGVKRL